jgi:CHAT domain-containing protein/tetratricopeptide (TPR) repeat protein
MIPLPSHEMRAKLLLLLCMVLMPSLLRAQSEIVETLVLTSALINHPDPQKRLAGEIAAAQADLSRKEASAGAQAPETANAASSLADLYLKAGDYERASPLIERALKIRRTSFGEEHPDTAASLHQLAQFREELGAFGEAETLYRSALPIRRRADADGIATAATLHALGRLLAKMDQAAEAERLLREALAIREQKLPVKDAETAYTLYELAKIEARIGHDSEAATLSGRAYKIFAETLGKQNPDTEDARSMGEPFADNLINAFANLTFDGKKAQPTRRQLYLSGPFNAREAQGLSDAAEALESSGNAEDREEALLMQERSLRIRQRVLGPEHPLTLQSLQRLGAAALSQHQDEKALFCARKAMFAQTRHLQRIFSFTDEQQRLAFQATVKPFSLFASLPEPEVPASDLATAALRFKGTVLDSLLAERQEADAAQNPALRPLLSRAAGAREAWHRLEADAIGASESDFPGIDSRREALQAQFQEIERDFARAGLGTGGLAASATPKQVASMLNPDAVLVEVIRYPHQLEGNRTEERYGAILLAATGEPRWVPLGDAADLERLVAGYQQSVRGLTDAIKLEADLRVLYDRLWLPIERVLPSGVKRVILSPDGSLNFVSFATLLAPDKRFLAEKVALSYVASGRDLLAERPPSSAKTLVICAAPDFNALPAPSSLNPSQPQSLDLMQTVERDAYHGLLKPLPGAAREAAALREQASGWGWQVTSLEGAEATEGRLRQVQSPRVLHLATHGFFLAEDDILAAKETLKNPMRRAVLALCGAQRTFDLWKLWKKDEVPPSASDGILTAEEVSALQLKGTWIVTLSACDTGLGEARAGEGVLGLRRGFIRAGAQNLLMTLWPINDQTTVEFMLDFYQRALATGDPPRALAEVQRDWLVKLCKESGLLRAAEFAGPFIMTTQGAQ